MMDSTLQRVYSAVVFLLGMLVLNLAYLTLYFNITALSHPAAMGMGVFGTLLCGVGCAFLVAGGEDGRGGVQWRLYCLVLFIAGMVELLTSIGIIFFAPDYATMFEKVSGLLAGLVLAGSSVGLLSFREPPPTTFDAESADLLANGSTNGEGE
jgi:hypothetical protein